MNTFTIASWNINSVRLRLPLVQQFVESDQPDILCLQETKVEDGKFPVEGLKALGYPYLAFAGEKSYNGVAIASKLPLECIDTVDFARTGQKRHIQATLPGGIELHNVYIPAGGDIPDPDENPKFRMKLEMVEALTEWGHTMDERPRIILGDFNIAPLEHDVWSSRQLRNVVSHTPIERDMLIQMQQANGWQDSVRHYVPTDQKSYSWWSYRARDWEASDRGRRLDHLWLSPALHEGLESAANRKEVRGWHKPSDHAPVIARIHWEHS